MDFYSDFDLEILGSNTEHRLRWQAATITEDERSNKICVCNTEFLENVGEDGVCKTARKHGVPRIDEHV